MSRSTTIEPPRTVEPVECSAKPSAGRVSCPSCGKTFAGGSVVTGAPVWSEQHACDLALRQFYCDHCNHIVSWREICDGQRLTGYALERRASLIRQPSAVRKFLAANPQATGVAQR